VKGDASRMMPVPTLQSLKILIRPFAS